MQVLALKRELFLLDKSILDIKKKLRDFEEKYRMRSEDFLEKFDNGLAGDDQDTMLWAAEALKLLEKEHRIIERIAIRSNMAIPPLYLGRGFLFKKICKWL